MTQLSLSAAARTAGISRSTLHDHIAAGKVSVQIDGQGRRTVDTSELLRVYGSLRGAPDSSAVQSGSQIRADADISAGQELLGRVAILDAENRGLRALLNEKDARIEELRHTVRLLEYKPARVPLPASEETKLASRAIPKLASLSDRAPVVVGVGVVIIIGLAFWLQTLHIIRLG